MRRVGRGASQKTSAEDGHALKENTYGHQKAKQRERRAKDTEVRLARMAK